MMPAQRETPNLGRFQREAWCLPSLRLTPEAARELDLLQRSMPRAGLSKQAAPAVYAGAAALQPADLLGGLIQYTGPAGALTMPTGAAIDAALPAGSPADTAFDFAVMNTGSGTATLGLPAGLSPIGSMAIAVAVSGSFRARKSAAGSFTIYRL